MKKRIIAILLSLSVFCFSFGLGNRRASAAATGTIAALVSVGVLAFELLGVMNGNYDNTANAIGSILSGVGEGVKLTFVGDDVINPFTGEVVYHEDGLWQTGVASIASSIQDMFDKGEISEVDGQIKLTYDQYLLLCDQLWSYSSKEEISFETERPYVFLDLEAPPSKFPISALPLPDLFKTCADYALCYYSADQIIFSDYYIELFRLDDQRFYGYSILYSDCDYNGISISYHSGSFNYFTSTSSFFSFLSLSNANATIWGESNDRNSTNCFVLSNGEVKYTPISNVDLSGCKLGLVLTTGYPSFLSSLNNYTVPTPIDLNDLSDVLPTEYNPSLSFPINPDLTRPLENQIMVGDVPGVSDLPLSEYQAKTNTDIDVPSVITSKFPFCIPFDFIRFLGVLCSDPVAPVFHIPISTNPGNLDAWSENQTVGEYLSPSDPMFEIDEEIVIDLSVIPLVQPVCYTCFIVGFIFLLLHITPKMIQH